MVNEFKNAAGVTFPQGFKAAGVKAGIKKKMPVIPATIEEIYIAGKEGTWAFVLYWRSNGGTRTGYVDLSQLQYTYKTSDMDFAYRKAKITKDCAMTDDPTLVKENLAYLGAGEYVTLLAYYTDHHEWAYVEAMAGNVPLRGFVLKDYVSVE